MMKRVLAVGVALVVIIFAVVALFVLRAPEQASGPIEAIPLAEPTTAPAASAPTGAPTQAAEPTTVAEPTTEVVASTGEAPILFEIVPEKSEARFLIDEVLRGQPVTVVGVTNQVAGQIEINPTDPSTSRLGVIQVNARALATDNNLRNRAIKNFILQTDQYEFVTFTPTEITGLPAAGTVGESYTFQLVGDLTIRNVTRPVTFDVTVRPVSTTQLEGTAATTVLYRDFELAIPDSPQVDTVADEVRLELSFVAEPAG